MKKSNFTNVTTNNSKSKNNTERKENKTMRKTVKTFVAGIVLTGTILTGINVNACQDPRTIDEAYLTSEQKTELKDPEFITLLNNGIIPYCSGFKDALITEEKYNKVIKTLKLGNNKYIKEDLAYCDKVAAIIVANTKAYTEDNYYNRNLNVESASEALLKAGYEDFTVRFIETNIFYTNTFSEYPNIRAIALKYQSLRKADATTTTTTKTTTTVKKKTLKKMTISKKSLKKTTLVVNLKNRDTTNGKSVVIEYSNNNFKTKKTKTVSIKSSTATLTGIKKGTWKVRCYQTPKNSKTYNKSSVSSVITVKTK